MTDAPRRQPTDPPRTPLLIWIVFALSAGLIGFEISLMRVLLYASWHHFAFLVISIVLFGFGASGTALCLFRKHLLPRSRAALYFLILATAVSMPLATWVVQFIPVSARFVPALLPGQAAAWFLYWMILAIPFFLGACGIGLALMTEQRRLPVVYAGNLAGGAAGALFALWAAHVFHPAWLALVMGSIALGGVVPLLAKTSNIRRLWMLGAISGTCAVFLFVPPSIRVDPFKYQNHVDRLVAGGRAVLKERIYGPRGVVDVYGGSVFHELAFLSVRRTPPQLSAVTIDGHWAGSIIEAGTIGKAEVVDHTMMAVPYLFAPDNPKVLLLGETGGANIWLAARNGATSIDVVQPNTELLSILENTPLDEGGGAFRLPTVRIWNTEPRHFVVKSKQPRDLIHLSAFESWAVSTSGIGGLQQDYLLTVEGLTACIENLSRNGILSVCRAIQMPPRDNVKMLATLSEALSRTGIERPARHTIIVRDYLAICTMVKSTPWAPGEIERIRRVCVERELTPVYFPWIRADELNHPDRLPGPAEGPGDWLHYAATRILTKSPGADFLFDEWAYDIRPASDDKPFFGNFFKFRSIAALKRAFGDLWLTRTEIAFLFVLVAMGIIAIIGLVSIVFPLAAVPAIRHARGKTGTFSYFTAIGLGYLMIEIVVLSKLTHLIGNTVQAGAVTIAGFLFFSGLGSLTAQNLTGMDAAKRTRLFVALVVTGILVLSFAGWIVSVAGSSSLFVRLCIGVLYIAPLAYLMGFPMPLGLDRLQKTIPAVVPWAWGINGFASVLAPPLATAMGMWIGFRITGLAALGLYAVAAAADRAGVPGNSSDRR